MGSPHDIQIIPAPWALMGSGYVGLLHVPKSFALQDSFIPDELKDRYLGGPGFLVCVDYIYSDAGPYRELLFIPGRFSFGSKSYYSITKIFVSTPESQVNGWNNWGIPKELADFDIAREAPRTERIRVSHQGRTFADLTFRYSSLKLPATTALWPKRWRSLAHLHKGDVLITIPSARLKTGPARLITASMDQAHFPDITRCRILAAWKTFSFFMVFPVAMRL